MVFQAYALFPNLNVADNIGFGLRIAGMPVEERRARVADMLRLIGLSGFEKRFPYEMSAASSKRVALARARSPPPRVLMLLDVPLSALDAKIRVSLREEIRAIQEDLGITTVFVTHDQEEALSISDRIVVMNAGRIEQIGTPSDIYNAPATRFVATFVGQLNPLSASVSDAATGAVERPASFRLPALPAAAVQDGLVSVAIRPERLSLAPRPARPGRSRGTIQDISFLGSVVRLKVDVAGTRLSIDTFNDPSAPAASRRPGSGSPGSGGPAGPSLAARRGLSTFFLADVRLGGVPDQERPGDANGRPLRSTDWLAGQLASPDLVLVDASWHLPNAARNARPSISRATCPAPSSSTSMASPTPAAICPICCPRLPILPAWWARWEFPIP